MASTSAYGQQAPLSRRAAGFALALLANLLLILMLLSLAPFAPSGPPKGRAPTLIDLPPAETPSKAKSVDRRKAVAAPSPPKTAPEPPPPPTPPVELNIMKVTNEVFAASDISKLPQRQTQVASNDAGVSTPGARAADEGGSTQTGPNGERLYNAQWYTEPTDAELAYYLPRNIPQGAVAMIACRTVARYHVEDCVELGESPSGLGLARAIRQAAWQFKVRPPSINGRPQVGEWVRIRFDFSKVRAP